MNYKYYIKKIQNGHKENEWHHSNRISVVDRVASFVDEKETLDVICLEIAS